MNVLTTAVELECYLQLDTLLRGLCLRVRLLGRVQARNIRLVVL